MCASSRSLDDAELARIQRELSMHGVQPPPADYAAQRKGHTELTRRRGRVPPVSEDAGERVAHVAAPTGGGAVVEGGQSSTGEENERATRRDGVLPSEAAAAAAAASGGEGAGRQGQHSGTDAAAESGRRAEAGGGGVEGPVEVQEADGSKGTAGETAAKESSDGRGQKKDPAVEGQGAGDDDDGNNNENNSNNNTNNNKNRHEYSESGSMSIVDEADPEQQVHAALMARIVRRHPEWHVPTFFKQRERLVRGVCAVQAMLRWHETVNVVEFLLEKRAVGKIETFWGKQTQTQETGTTTTAASKQKARLVAAPPPLKRKYEDYVEISYNDKNKPIVYSTTNNKN